MKRTAIQVVTLALVAAMTAIGFPRPVAAAGTSHLVTVEDFRFAPETIYVALGDAVEWKHLSGTHTVAARDGSFRGSISSTNPSFQYTFLETGSFEYGCTIHTSMRGEVVVEAPGTFTGDVLYVPSDAPTLRSALQVVRSGTTIVLEDRVPVVTIDAPIRVTTPGVTITSGSKGRKAVATGRVTLVPPNAPVDYAIEVLAPDVTIRNLTITNFARAGVNVAGQARDARLQNLQLSGNRDAGIQNAGNATITDVVASGSRRAGISLRDCDDCGRVERVMSTGNFVGLEMVNGAGLTVSNSTFAANANAIAIVSSSGAWLDGNTMRDNTNVNAPRPSMFEDDAYTAAGAGVWIGGGEWVSVRGNTVDGHRWGIAATALGPTPATNNTISTNTVSGSERVDLSWDGIGTGTCFRANTFGTSVPAEIETLYQCDGLTPAVGVPAPVAHPDLALHALGTYYCSELGAC